MGWSRWPWTNRPYVCIAVRLTLVLFGFDPVWGPNLALVSCQNMLHWRWWVCVKLMGWSRWPWTKRWYVCIPVLDFGAIWVWFSVRPSSHPHSISICATWRSWMCVELMEQFRWPWTKRWYVCILVFDVGRVSGVQSPDTITLSFPCQNVLQWRRSVWSFIPVESMQRIRWNRTIRAYVFILVLYFGRIIWVRCSVRSYSYINSVAIYCNGDDWCAFSLVESMGRSRWPWTGRAYVCIFVFDWEAFIGVRLSVIL